MTTETRTNLSAVLSMAGLLVIMAASALPFLHVERIVIAWIYAAGAACLLAGRIIGPVPEGAPLRLRRLLRMEVWTALVFVAGAVFLFIPGSGGNDWIAFTLAGGVLTIYTSIMIPRQKLD